LNAHDDVQIPGAIQSLHFGSFGGSIVKLIYATAARASGWPQAAAASEVCAHVDAPFSMADQSLLRGLVQLSLRRLAGVAVESQSAQQQTKSDTTTADAHYNS